MLFDFTYYNPTRIHFGKDSLNNLKGELDNFGETVLLMYGKNSIKKIGLYDEIIKILNDGGKKVVELSGVMSNPTYSKVLEGGKLVRDNNVDLILAVGGGSVIDCAKAISVSAYCEGDAFTRYWMNFEPVNNKIIPVGSVLTMVGTGSEMNGNAVITKMDTNEKLGTGSDKLKPQVSILDPEYLYTLPAIQTAAGTADIMSHIFESYFKKTKGAFVQDKFSEGLLETCIKYCPIALKDPKNMRQEQI